MSSQESDGQNRPVSVINDCLLPLIGGLLRMTGKLWSIASPKSDRPGDDQLKPYLRIAGFRRDPAFALNWLYKDCKLDLILAALQVHESVALAKEVEACLNGPLERLQKAQFRACQIHAGDLDGLSKEVMSRPHSIDDLHMYLIEHPEPHYPPYVEAVYEEWDGIRNSLHDAAKYLANVVAALRGKRERVNDGSTSTGKSTAGCNVRIAEELKPDRKNHSARAVIDYIDKCGPKRRQLLSYLYDDGRQTQRRIAEATRHVYGNDNADNRRKLIDLKKEANKQLSEHGLAYEISTKGETIALRKTNGEITVEK